MWDEPNYLAESQHDLRMEFNDPGMMLPGWPGYRTRPGRSGFDPLDTSFEDAHMTGRIIKMIFTGRYYTDDPLFVTLLMFFGYYLLANFTLLVTLSLCTQISYPWTQDDFEFWGLVGGTLPMLIIGQGYIRFLIRRRNRSDENGEEIEEN